MMSVWETGSADLPTTSNPTGDALKVLSGFHFLPETPTEEQREHCRGSGLYAIGDCRLMWVNEGDFYEATAHTPPPVSLDEVEALERILGDHEGEFHNYTDQKIVRAMLTRFKEMR